ncbi:MAG: DUF5330 domain-containing protein [Pararhizobium sp.]
MWFLVKAIFGFALVLLILPFFSSTPEPAADTGQQVAIGDTIEAAKSAIDDVTGICQRRPDVCKAGGAALSALGDQAREGALIAYRYLDSHFGGGKADMVETGTVADAAPSATRTPVVAVPQTAPTAAALPTAAQVRDAAHTMVSLGETVLPHPYAPPQR